MSFISPSLFHPQIQFEAFFMAFFKSFHILDHPYWLYLILLLLDTLAAIVLELEGV